MKFYYGYCIGVIIAGVVCGLIAKAVASNRGMEGGFWWGFFLTIIGIIVVAVRPNDRKPETIQTTSVPSPKRDEEILADGGWKCDCGKVNYQYLTSCSCGKSKWDVEQRRKQEREKSKKEEIQTIEKSNVDQIKEFKELLDIGAITQEEYDTKKKQILGL